GADVPPSRQIVFEFNRAVVPVGRMERAADEIPITISPSLSCQWRWISTRTLACNLDEKAQMLPATEYAVEVKPGLTTIDGVTIPETYRHRFTTRRPEVRGSYFRRWRTSGIPIMRISWDQAVAKSSVAKHLFLLDAKN